MAKTGATERQPIPPRTLGHPQHHPSSGYESKRYGVTLLIRWLLVLISLPPQFVLPARDVIDSLIDLVQRENVQTLGLSNEIVVQHLVFARSMPGRPIPDALIVAAAVAGGAESLATFDRDQRRYGIPIRQP